MQFDLFRIVDYNFRCTKSGSNADQDKKQGTDWMKIGSKAVVGVKVLPGK